MHFYIIFGTNLLTQSPVPVSVFLLVSVFRRKGISNGMKPSGELFLERKQSRRLGVDVREASWMPRGREARPTPWARPHPRGPLVAPLTDFFHLYKSIYPKTFEDNLRSGVPPPQAYVATKNLLGARSGTLPEGGIPHLLTGGPAQNVVFLPISVFRRKGISNGVQTE